MTVVLPSFGRITSRPRGYLCIEHVQYNDAGSYTCHMPTEKDSLSTTLKVKGMTYK